MRTTPSVKILPPPRFGPLVARPALERRLADSLARRLTVVVAGAGFGKTTLLSSWAATTRSAWYTLDATDRSLPVLVRGLADALRLRVPGIHGEVAMALEGAAGPNADEPTRAQALASLIAEGLARELDEDLALVLDDVHEVEGSAASIRLIDELSRQAPQPLHVVLASRAEPPFQIERLRGRGQVLDLPAAALAFTEDEVAELLRMVLGEEPGDLAASLHGLTDGWPAAVRLGAEVAASAPPGQRRAALEAIRRPGSPVFEYFAREVLGGEGEEVQEFLRATALLDAFTPELCEAIGLDDAERTIADLAARGLFFEPREEGWFSLSPLIREVVERSGTRGKEGGALLASAAKWLLEEERVEDALQTLLRAGDHQGVAAVLEEHGEVMIAGGAVEAVIRSIEPLPTDLRTPALDRLEGEARQIGGDWDRALACFLRAAPGEGPLDAALAWRMGLIHHLRGDLEAALATYERGRVEGEDRDVALLLAWTAAAHWLRGDLERSREMAGRARDVAVAVDDPRAEAAAYTTLAMVAALEGDRRANDAYYLRALDAAERARDVLQIARIRTNRASRFSEEGDHEDALRELDVSVGLAELTGFANFHALGVNNRAQARFGLGRLEEARADFESALALYQRMGSKMVAYPLAGLGDISRTRGDLAQSRAAYEEATAVAEEAGDLQGLVPAMAGLARVLAAEDPEAARSLAERAVELGRGMGYVSAQLALGWVALAEGDTGSARQAAEGAAEAARERRDRPGLAEALTLAAMADPDREWVATALEEAAEIWRGVGNPLEEAIAAVVAATLVGGPDARTRLERGRRRLAAFGVRLPAAAQAAGPLHLLAGEQRAPLAIQALGGFRVLRDGRAVPASEWQSKKARDLLKLLVARRGRLAPRELLMEVLWPDEHPEKVANRLSVALTTVRAVLDPDRALPQDHFVFADRETVALEPDRVDVDVERFLADGSAALELVRSGSAEEALALLRDAEASYSGDFLEENLYDDWAVALREEARAAYLSVCRELARLAVGRGDHDAAGRYLLRIIERDPYEERAHLGLVSVLARAGRHGEARRAYRIYRGRMEELDVEPEPFPSA